MKAKIDIFARPLALALALSRPKGTPEKPKAPRKRKSGYVREGSLAAKLVNIKIGESIWLEDRFFDGKPSHLERSIQSLMAKSAALNGRKFKTRRHYIIAHDPLRVRTILEVERAE